MFTPFGVGQREQVTHRRKGEQCSYRVGRTWLTHGESDEGLLLPEVALHIQVVARVVLLKVL